MSTVLKRSITIAGHATSISLEAAFWDALREMAAERGRGVADLVAEIDGARGEAENLSSAIRVAVLRHYRERAALTDAASADGPPASAAP